MDLSDKCCFIVLLNKLVHTMYTPYTYTYVYNAYIDSIIVYNKLITLEKVQCVMLLFLDKQMISISTVK